QRIVAHPPRDGPANSDLFTVAFYRELFLARVHLCCGRSKSTAMPRNRERHVQNARVARRTADLSQISFGTTLMGQASQFTCNLRSKAKPSRSHKPSRASYC